MAYLMRRFVDLLTNGLSSAKLLQMHALCRMKTLLLREKAASEFVLVIHDAISDSLLYTSNFTFRSQASIDFEPQECINGSNERNLI